MLEFTEIAKKAIDYSLSHISDRNTQNHVAKAYRVGFEDCQKEYEEKLRWISPNIKPNLLDKDSMFSVNVSIRVESEDYEYSGYYNFHTQKWLIYPNEEPFEFQLIVGWRYFL